MTSSPEWTFKQLSRLRDGRIIRIGVTNAGFGFNVPALVVEMPDGSLHRVIILCDDEGNGPGSVSIEPMMPDEQF